MSPEHILSVDIGGTKTLGLLIDRSMEITGRRLAPTPKGNEAVRDATIELIAALLSSAQGLGIQPAGIAIGAPGFVDAATGSMLEAENLEVVNLPLVGPIEEQFHLPTRLYHDVRAATLGEALYGAGTGRRHFIFLNIGTGLSVGLYLDGKVYEGAQGHTGEIGHFAPSAVGPGKPCGLDERLETLVSGPALVRRAAAGLARQPGSLIHQMAGGDPGRITTQLIGEAALRRDPLALQLMEETADMLGVAVGGMLDLLNPECIILGGGLAQMGQVLIEPLGRAMGRYAIESVPLIPAALGSDAGAIGAAAYYFSQAGAGA
jgi:glucokinase